jgi:Ca-activated chloride channel homolog
MPGFAHPWVLLLLIGLPAYLYLSRGWGRSALVFSRAGALAHSSPRSHRLLAQAPGGMRAIVFVALVLALAGPRTGAAAVDVEAEGIAIMMVIDISSSMLAEDFAPRNRMTVAKLRTAEFVRGRTYDRIGLVAFAGEALTLVPLTVDYDVIFAALDQLDIGMLEDGTAIGTAIATGANRLRHAPGDSRVMILMTDGENNRGEIHPLTAARAATAFGIRVYGIGVGTHGVAPVPVARDALGNYRYANLPVSIDDELLTEIAEMSGGRYFRATNDAALDSIYQQIDRLERSTVQVRRYVDYTPRHLPLVLLAGLLLAGEWLLRGSRWGRLP